MPNAIKWLHLHTLSTSKGQDLVVVRQEGAKLYYRYSDKKRLLVTGWPGRNYAHKMRINQLIW